MKKSIVTFEAKIKKRGINPYVEVPRKVIVELGKSGKIPVAGRLNGKRIQATIMPLERGHILYINGEMRRTAGVEVGDTILLELHQDKKPRVRPVPHELMEAMAKSTNLLKAWKALTPSRRNEILAYLNSLKTEQARRRNLVKLIRELKKR